MRSTLILFFLLFRCFSRRRKVVLRAKFTSWPWTSRVWQIGSEGRHSRTLFPLPRMVYCLLCPLEFPLARWLGKGKLEQEPSFVFPLLLFWFLLNWNSTVNKGDTRRRYFPDADRFFLATAAAVRIKIFHESICLKSLVFFFFLAQKPMRVKRHWL